MASRDACATLREASGYAAIGETIAAARLAESDTFWSHYYPPGLLLDRSKPWPYKNHAAERILDSMAPRSMVDLACNAGWYSQVGALKGIDVIALDADETCVNRLFDAAASGLHPIVAGVADICAPISLAGPVQPTGLDAGMRFASELALALAISHHLVLSPPWLTFDELANLLARYTTRYLLTEFIGFGPEFENPYSAADYPEATEWYTLDNFVLALGRRFREVVLVPGPPGRRLVLAEK